MLARRLMQASTNSQSELLISGNFKSYAADPYSAYTGMWGLNLPQNDQLQATSSMRIPSTFPKGMSFEWNVTPDPDWTGVNGFLHVDWGNYDWSPGTITSRQVYTITDLSVDVGWTFQGDESTGLLCECWLTSAPTPTGELTTKLYEVAFWPKVSADSAAYADSLPSVGSGSFTDSNSVTWEVREGLSGENQPYFIAYRTGNVDFEGVLCFQDFFAFLIAAHKISGNEWFNGVGFGPEPKSGQGSVSIDQFAPNCVGAARVPWTIDDLIATEQSSTSVLLSWTPAAGADSHQYRIDGGTWTDTSDSASQTLTGLTDPITSHTFEVRGVNATGSAAQSNTAYASSPPPVIDTFSGTLDTTNNWKGNTYGVSVVSGRLRVPCSNTFPQASTGAVQDLNSYDVWIEVPTVPDPGNGTKQTQFILQSGSNQAVFNFTGSTTAIAMQLTGQSNTSVTYNATNHRWLRFSCEGGNLLWQASPDNVTWTTLRSIAAPAWVTGGLLEAILSSSYYGSEVEGTYAEFDNFCVVPA